MLPYPTGHVTVNRLVNVDGILARVSLHKAMHPSHPHSWGRAENRTGSRGWLLPSPVTASERKETRPTQEPWGDSRGSSSSPERFPRVRVHVLPPLSRTELCSEVIHNVFLKERQRGEWLGQVAHW
jgi:hypothetical protein